MSEIGDDPVEMDCASHHAKLSASHKPQGCGAVPSSLGKEDTALARGCWSLLMSHARSNCADVMGSCAV